MTLDSIKPTNNMDADLETDLESDWGNDDSENESESGSENDIETDLESMNESDIGNINYESKAQIDFEMESNFFRGENFNINVNKNAFTVF
jgi:hypothetical protein